MKPRILKNKFVNVDAEDEAEVIAALRLRELSGTAGVVEKYEAVIRRFFNTPYALAFCNGTLSIHAALHALGVKPEDEVILPATAPVMTALPVLLAAAIPVFVDTSGFGDFGFDLKDLSKKITSRTKAIITVPMWGYPVEMQDLIDLATQMNIPVIEDVAQAHGTELGGKFLGTFGDIGSFSTHDRKLICTGEGGMLLVRDLELCNKLMELRTFGRVIHKTTENASYLGKFGYQFGLNYKINALGAALGISQTRKLKRKLEVRTRNAGYILAGIKSVEGLTEIPVVGGGKPNYYALILQASQLHDSSPISSYLKAKGVISDTLEYDYRPLYELPLFQDYASSCPNTEVLTKRIFTVPTHEGLNDSDLDRIVDCVREAFARY